MSEVPIWEKVTLSIDEAVAYSGIGRNKMYELSNMPLCPFALRNGKAIRIKRKELERYLLNQRSI